MQLDRLMTKTISRLAKSGAANLRQPAGATATAGATTARDDGLRGSGSWANEWIGAKSAINRAKAMAHSGKKRGKAAPNAEDVIPEGSIRTRALMSTRDLKLHNWIADRLEAEAPTCSLHYGVALHAFLSSSLAHEGYDPLSGLVADMLIVDELGQPVAALIREQSGNPAMQLLLIDALLDADVPIVDLPTRPSLAQLWATISETLPV